MSTLAPPVTDEVTRRRFLAVLAAAGLTTACAKEKDPSAAPTPTAGTRTVMSDDGPVQVPVNPQRVVAAIGSFEIDMVAVGVMPVLTTTFAGPWVKLDPSVPRTANIPPTAEELLAARPDLVLGWTWVTKEPQFDDLRKVAPYVGLGETPATAGVTFDGTMPTRSWDTLFLSVCDVLGRRQRGLELVAEFESRLEDLAVRRAAKGPVSVARIEFYETGTFSYRGQEEDTAALMKRLGIRVVGPPKSENAASLERLPEIDADWLVVAVGGDSLPRTVFDQVSQTELYKKIPAVAAGRVHVVDGALWPGFGHLWARALADDLERLFVA